MLEDKLITCDSNIPWHHNRYSKHHLMSQLAKTNDVVFVNPEEDLLGYLRRVNWRADRLWQRFERPPDEQLTVFTPLMFPGRGQFAFAVKLDEPYFVRQVRKVVRRYPDRELILFLGRAWHVYLLDAFPDAACTIYHCSDNFAALFSGAFREAFERREREIIERADIVLCSHPSLVEKCSQYSSSVHYLEHAVDERFFCPRDYDTEADCPDGLAGIPSPRVGFVGSLDATLDYELISETARETPDISYVFIGPSAESHTSQVEGLVQLANVWYLGPRPWASLPKYLWHMDVGIVPFAINEFTASGSPLKLFEYLAAGLPVVSTGLTFPGPLRSFIRDADTPQRFGSHIRQAIADGSNEGRIQEQVAAMKARYTWQARAEELSHLVLSVVEPES